MNPDCVRDEGRSNVDWEQDAVGGFDNDRGKLSESVRMDTTTLRA